MSVYNRLSGLMVYNLLENMLPFISPCSLGSSSFRQQEQQMSQDHAGQSNDGAHCISLQDTAMTEQSYKN